ncbi:MAG: hypothetical protein BWX73_01238 [Lentisphaerae bacterium ADurb.Bin082]|nr:MAG: hypothetical protein BWX73_01238 [Lentisphaerae bacterium ADurb.Bin082]
MVISLANAAFCRLPFCCDQFDMESFTTGLLAGLALMLIVGLIVHLCMKGSGACKLIHIVDGENGDFNITSSAVRSFLQRIVADYPQLDLNSIALKNTRNGLTLDLYLNVLPETDLVTLRKTLRERIYAELENKLGIAEQIKKVNIDIEGFDAKAEAIAKRNRGVLNEAEEEGN